MPACASTGTAALSAGTDSPVRIASSILQAAGADEADIGRHPRAGLDQDDIAGHDRIGADGDAVTIAQHRGLGVDHAADRLQRLDRLPLLDEADDRIGERHRQHDAGIDPMFERRREDRRHQQRVDENVVKLEKEARRGPRLTGCGNRFGPKAVSRACSLIRIEPVLAAGERFQRHIGYRGHATAAL